MNLLTLLNLGLVFSMALVAGVANYEHLIEKVLKESSGKIRAFHEHLLNKGNKVSSRYATLRNLARAFQYGIEEITKEKALVVQGKLMARHKKGELSWNTYTVSLKSYKQYLDFSGGDTRWLKGFKVRAERKAIEIISESDLKSLLISCNGNSKLETLVALMYDTGMRITEAMYMRVCDIILQEDGYVKVKVGEMIEYMKNEYSRRTLYLEPSCLSKTYLVSHLKKFSGDSISPLFPGKDGQFHRNLTSTMSKVFKRAGVAGSSHFFRKTCATLKQAEGWNQRRLEKWFGWSRGSSQPSMYEHGNEVTWEQELKKIKKGQENRTFCVKCNNVIQDGWISCPVCGKVVGEDHELDTLRKEMKAMEKTNQYLKDNLEEVQAFMKMAREGKVFQDAETGY